MSRSNPTETTVHPCTRWFTWDGDQGVVVWYDKVKKEQVEHPPKLTFVVLDRLCVINGFDKRNQCGIVSNEVRDTRTEKMVVRSFKGGLVAEGFYQDIKDKIKVAGASFAFSLYACYRPEPKGPVQLCNFRMSGCSRSAWMDFEKEHTLKAIYERAVRLDGFKEGKSGKIVFRAPVFKIAELSPAGNDEATKLDKEILQPYMESYFKRPTGTRADASHPAAEAPPAGNEEHVPEAPEEDTEVPF